MKKIIFTDGCVICVMAIQNGRYANKVLRIDGEVNLATLISIRDFIFSNSAGTMKGTICDSKSFGKGNTPNKKSKTEVFDISYDGKEVEFEEKVTEEEE